MSEEQSGELSGERAGRSNAARLRELNDTVRYTMWSVFRAASPLPERDEVSGEAEALLDQLAGKDVVVRGTYDVSGLRADADLMIWWHAPELTDLQDAYHRLRGTELGRHLEPVWSQAALHRPAEFNKSHIPAFLADEPPGDQPRKGDQHLVLRQVVGPCVQKVDGHREHRHQRRRPAGGEVRPQPPRREHRER